MGGARCRRRNATGRRTPHAQLQFLEDVASLLRPDGDSRVARRAANGRNLREVALSSRPVVVATLPPSPAGGGRRKTRQSRSTSTRRNEFENPAATPSGGVTTSIGSRIRTPSIERQAMADSQTYLNPAERQLLSSLKKAQGTVAPSTKKTKRTVHVFSGNTRKRRGSEEQFRASLSDCWARDSEDPGIQQWLRKKDQLCRRERRAERRRREEERREVEEKVRKQAARDELAKTAYREWMEKKKSKARRKKDNAVIKTAISCTNKAAVDHRHLPNTTARRSTKQLEGLGRHTAGSVTQQSPSKPLKGSRPAVACTQQSSLMVSQPKKSEVGQKSNLRTSRTSKKDTKKITQASQPVRGSKKSSNGENCRAVGQEAAIRRPSKKLKLRQS